MTDMIANFFKQSKPIVFVVLVFLLSFFFFIEVFQNINFPLSWTTIGDVALKYILLISCYVLFDYAIKQFEIQKGHSFGGLFFVLFSVFLIPEVLDGYIVYAFILFFIGLLRLLGLTRSARPTLAIFEAVFFLYLASLFYHPLLFVLVLVLVVTLVFVKANWRYFIAPILAVSAAVILTQLFNLIWYDKALQLDFFWPEWEFQAIGFYTISQIFSFAVWCLSVLIFVFQAFNVLQKRALYHQKLTTCFLYLALLGFISSWFSISSFGGLWLISIMPICVYLGDFIFRFRKKKLKEVLLWVFIVFAVVFSLIQN
ncbi:hypothetical protein [Flavobacteriaceae bacterium 14752]|uniref:hypothetical protein n=1 Tax=Mesohalobacter salilacus TaxID=2491711 RepID=UPI000F62D52C|nr:hypothetical protein EIG84_02090 [Flavobacteriaceae bacterium 14752]